MQYLNAVGGATLLDALSEDDISRIMITRISAILKGQAVDIDVDESEEDQLFEEIDEDLEEAEMTLQEEEDEYDGLRILMRSMSLMKILTMSLMMKRIRKMRMLKSQ